MSNLNPYTLIPESNHKAYNQLIQATKKFNPIIGFNPESNKWQIYKENKFSYSFATWPQQAPIYHLIIHNFKNRKGSLDQFQINHPRHPNQILFGHSMSSPYDTTTTILDITGNKPMIFYVDLPTSTYAKNWKIKKFELILYAQNLPIKCKINDKPYTLLNPAK